MKKLFVVLFFFVLSLMAVSASVKEIPEFSGLAAGLALAGAAAGFLILRRRK